MLQLPDRVSPTLSPPIFRREVEHLLETSPHLPESEEVDIDWQQAAKNCIAAFLPEEERRALEDRRALVWSTSSGPLRPFFPIPGSKHRAFVRNLPSPQFPHDSQTAYSPIARNISTTSLQRTIVYATMNTSYGCVRSWPQERLSGRCRPAVRTYERLSRPSSVLNSSPKRNCSALTVGCFARRASMAFEPSPEWAKTTTRSSWILASAEALLCRFRYWLCWPGSTRCFPCRMTLPDSLSAFKALVTLTR